MNFGTMFQLGWHYRMEGSEKNKFDYADNSGPDISIYSGKIGIGIVAMI